MPAMAARLSAGMRRAAAIVPAGAVDTARRRIAPHCAEIARCRVIVSHRRRREAGTAAELCLCW